MALSKNVTIRQIADQANVSIATASRIISQTGTVKPETREKVLQAMRDLSYQAKGSGHKIILASFPDFSNPFNSELINGIQASATRRGYQVLLQQMTDYASPEAYKHLFSNQIYSGIIFAHTLPNAETLSSLHLKYPIVICSECSKTLDVPFVVIDDFTAALNALNYLISIGKKKIALLNTTFNHNYAVQREKGYRAALLSADLPVYPQWVMHLPDINFDLACSVAFNILSASDFPDAFFCVSDVFASAVIKAARLAQRAVPEDIAIVGFDNVSLTTMTVPTITTVSQPMYQIGWQSGNLLIDQIEGVPQINRHIVLGTELIVRGST